MVDAKDARRRPPDARGILSTGLDGHPGACRGPGLRSSSRTFGTAVSNVVKDEVVLQNQGKRMRDGGCEVSLVRVALLRQRPGAVAAPQDSESRIGDRATRSPCQSWV